MADLKTVIAEMQDYSNTQQYTTISKTLKDISDNTKLLKPLSEDTKKIHVGIERLTKSLSSSFSKKMAQSEALYEEAFKKKPSSPQRVLGGDDKGKGGKDGISMWGGILSGMAGATVAGVSAYLLNPEFKAKVDSFVGGISNALFGEETTNKIKATISKGMKDAVKFISDKIFGGIITFPGLENALTPEVKSSSPTAAGGSTKSMLERVESTFEHASDSLAATMLGVWEGAKKNLSKPFDEAYNANTKDTKTLLEIGMDKFRGEQTQKDTAIDALKAELDKKTYEKNKLTTPEVATRQEMRDIWDKRKVLAEEIKRLEEQIKQAKEKPETSFTAPTPTPPPGEKPKTTFTTPAQAKEITERNNNAALENYRRQQAKKNSTAPQKISVSEYNKRYGEAAASNEPTRYRGSSGNNVKTAMDFFLSNNFTHAQAAGIVGNLQVESYHNIRPDADNGSHYGIAQWDQNRQRIFEQVIGKPIQGSSLMEQLKFLLYELRSNSANGLAGIQAAQTPRDAAIAFEKGFERSGGQLMEKRIRNAEILAGGSFTPTQEPTTTPVPVPNIASSGSEMGLPSGDLIGDAARFLPKGMISREDVGAINEGVRSQVDAIMSKTQNFFGATLTDMYSELNKVTPTVTGGSQTINNYNTTNQATPGGTPNDISNPVDIDVAQIMMQVV